MNPRTLVAVDTSEKIHVIDVRSEEELEVRIANDNENDNDIKANSCLPCNSLAIYFSIKNTEYETLPHSQ